MIALLGVGLWMSDLEAGDLKWFIYGIHKSLGITILGLVILRVLWKQINITPNLPVDSASWEIKGARLTHFALYVLMFGMPISGWIMSSAGGHAISYFGLVEIPEIVDKNKELGKLAWNAHGYLGYAAIAVISLHTLAAIYHHFIRKDNILTRMLPNYRKNSDLVEKNGAP